MRWVDNVLEAREIFIGLYEINDIESITLIKVIKDVLLRLNLSLANIRGQCYDGASVMTGHKNVVAKCIQDIKPRAVLTHCYGHSLNLAVPDSVKACKIMKDVLETVREITKLIKFSPRTETILRAVKEEAGFHYSWDTSALSNTIDCQTR